MTKFIIILSILAAGFVAQASGEECKKISIRAATLLSAGVNQNEDLSVIETHLISENKTNYVLEVVFDYARPNGGASVTYLVTAEKLFSPAQPELACARVVKIELTGEE